MFNSSEAVTVAAGAAGGETKGLHGESQPRAFPVAKVAAATVILGAVIALPLYGPDAGIAAYDIYKALVFVHVTVALVAFGSTFAMPVLQPLAARSGIVTLRLALKFSEQLERMIITPGSFIVIATGIGLMLSDMTGYRDNPPTWLLLAMAWVAVALVLAHGVQGPNLRKAIALLDRTPDEGPPPAALMPIAARMKLVGQILSLSTVGVMFLMIWRPTF